MWNLHIQLAAVLTRLVKRIARDFDQGDDMRPAHRRDISHSCRSAASVACCSGSMVPVLLSAPNTGLRQPHEQTAWTAPSPSCWMVVECCTTIGVLLVNDWAAHRPRPGTGGEGAGGHRP